MTPMQARALVSTIDLHAVVTKVRVQQQWDAAAAEHAEREYRDYLAANLVYPDRRVAPSLAADEIWHAHILDTAKYAADCRRVFGSLLHHVPNYEPYLKVAAEGTAGALCFAQKQETVEAAGCVPCFGQNEESTRQTALCFAQKAEAAEEALCFAAKAEPAKNAALCFAAKDDLPAAAMCFAAKVEQADAALCFAQKAGQPEATALCFNQIESPEAAALCFASREVAPVLARPAVRRVRAKTRRTRRSRA